MYSRVSWKIAPENIERLWSPPESSTLTRASVMDPRAWIDGTISEPFEIDKSDAL